jgi:AcrR family transcriptional regulator
MSPESRRRAIVEAVVPLVVDHGAEVTTKQIAEAAGIAEGTIFRVFPDKAALMIAVAAETVNPAHGKREWTEALAGAEDLRTKIVRTVEHLVARFAKTMAVMIALRGVVMLQPRDQPPPQGPPQFMIEANRALHAALTDLFDAHRDELTVPPATAAIALRSLVFGSRHPGMDFETLTPDEIADVLIQGIARGGKPGC